MRRTVQIVYEYKNDSKVYTYDMGGSEDEDQPKAVEQSVRAVNIERPNTFNDTLKARLEPTILKPKEAGKDSRGSQKYQDLVKRLKRNGELWEDPDFPADMNSLDPDSRYYSNLEWKRPKEVCQNPRFIKDGATRFDIVQGNLGNCWFLAAIGALCSDSKLLLRVVPKEQSFNEDYVGAFRFNFWQDDHWVEVIVDDRLPYQGGQLYFTQSADKDEFWTSLMEKAYAKLNGSYESMKAGYSAEAMADFTGGIVETFYLEEDQPEELFDQVSEHLKHGSLMTAGTVAGNGNYESELGNGLLSGHSYTVTGFNKIMYRGEENKLIRLRNPHGKTEWRGEWSDKSREWDEISERDRKKVNLVIEEDGEFWMPFKDFLIYYDKLEVCHQSADVLDDGTGYWHEVIKKGSWIRGKSAGGCRTNPDTFHLNPRFEFDLNEESDRRDGNGHLIISLIQTGRRKNGLPFLTIGFSVYKVSTKGPPVGPLFFRMSRPAASSSYVNVRDISGHFRIPAGRYFVVPSTMNPDEEADFILRILKEN